MVTFILIVLGLIVTAFMIVLIVCTLPSKTLKQIETKVKKTEQ